MCENQNHPRCNKLEAIAGTPGHDSVIKFSYRGELSIKLTIFDKEIEAPVRTDQYYNTVGWSVMGNNHKFLMMLLEKGALQNKPTKELPIPIKIGENTMLVKCKIVDRQHKPFIIGMQTLIAMGFCIGIGEHCLVVQERPAEVLYGLWPHNEIPIIDQIARTKPHTRLTESQAREQAEERPSRIPRRVRTNL